MPLIEKKKSSFNFSKISQEQKQQIFTISFIVLSAKLEKSDGQVTNDEIQAFKDEPIFTYCAAGRRAERAKNLLIKNGFTNVTNLGGIQDASKKLEKEIVQE